MPVATEIAMPTLKNYRPMEIRGLEHLPDEVLERLETIDIPAMLDKIGALRRARSEARHRECLAHGAALAVPRTGISDGRRRGE